MTDNIENKGYGHPPEDHQFNAGAAGNRNTQGRPRGSKNRKTIVRKIAGERHRVTENGRKVTRTTAELLLDRLRIMAIKGNPKAVKYFQILLKRHEPDVNPYEGCGFFFLTECANSVDEWVEMYGSDDAKEDLRLRLLQEGKGGGEDDLP